MLFVHRHYPHKVAVGCATSMSVEPPRAVCFDLDINYQHRLVGHVQKMKPIMAPLDLFSAQASSLRVDNVAKARRHQEELPPSFSFHTCLQPRQSHLNTISRNSEPFKRDPLSVALIFVIDTTTWMDAAPTPATTRLTTNL